jgi:NADH-quinone oxidoreductase subunit L
MLSDVVSWLVWILPLAASCFVPVIARLGGKARDYFVVLVSLITAVLAFSLVWDVYFGSAHLVSSGLSWIPNLGARTAAITAGVLVDPLAVLFTILIAFFGVIISVYSIGYMAKEEGLTRYYFYLLLFIGSMIGLVVSDNFLQLFIFWEMVGLCSYALVSFWSKRPEAVRSGIKVFLMTRVGDVALLGAIGILYASLGSFSLSYTIAHLGSVSTPALTAVAFLVLGAAIAKSAQLPLFTWLYSAMEAPTSISAILHAATMVKAGIYLVARFILILTFANIALSSLPYWLPTLAWIGVLTAFIGATLALYTTDIKGVLAYSTVSQLGLMMAALGTVAASSTGWFASLFHMMSHAFFEGLGFLLAGGIIHAVGTRDMRLMGGLRKVMPITFGLALVMILTTSGIPPFAAFFSKGLVITSITDAGNLLQIILVYAVTALTFAYSLRFFTLTFLGKKSDHLTELHVHETPKVMLIPAAVLAVLCIVWGFAEPWLGNLMQATFSINLVNAFFSTETAIFMLILIPVGLLVYLTYFRNSAAMSKFRSSSNPLGAIMKHAYGFDDLYEKVIVRGIMVFSRGIDYVEEKGFTELPQSVASGIMSATQSIHRYIDALGGNVIKIGQGPDSSGSKAAEKSSSTMQHYVAAAVLGFVLIVILIIITVGV